MRAFAVGLLAALLLAGCGSKATPATDEAAPAVPPLQGWVVDVGLRPLRDVQVRVLDGNQSAQTDASGHFELQGVPHDEPMVLVASLERFEPSSKQVSVPEGSAVQVNFTLVPVPVKVPKLDVLKFKGFLACQAATGPMNQTVDCSNGTQKDIWQLAAAAELEGAVIEVHWTAATPMAERMHARLVTTDLGKLNEQLGDVTGKSPLRIEVPRETAMLYYGSGGLMKLYVNLVASSTAPAAGLSAQQDFTAYASLFYNQPAPAGYIVSGG
ncbi:MAG TPA: carboxypeptidase regulatory-like domain-containing protein [Candidatus Thermoplasmatota archaeon]|nr:carboxypeptidase regulatory-like domain-containing protein [Candidatus Thermoplasmatota archaeon]